MDKYQNLTVVFGVLVIATSLYGIFQSNSEILAEASVPPLGFKVAFIGDQGLGSTDSIPVLQLIKNEGANMVLHQGDFDYSDNPAAWDQQITGVLGADFPYFASIGNHDVAAWPGYQQKLYDRLAKISGAVCTGDLGVKATCTYQGLLFILSGVGTMGTGHDVYIKDQLAQDNSIWRICSWHKNMKAMQVGGKSDATGWGVYEECKNGGAIIATAHEHSYHRTKTLISTQTQTVDPNWPDPNIVRVAPGSSFVFVSGLGGASIRNQDLCLPTTFPYGCNGVWAKIYTSDQGANYGALFCSFNVGGQANKAQCYFKDISGNVPDQFEITSFMGAAAGSPDFTLSPSPNSLMIQQGGSGSSTVTVTSVNGFNSPVTLSLSGNPAGVTTSFSANPVTPPSGGSTQSLLTISVDATATAGTYSLTVTGTSGALSHSTTIPLTIPAPDFSLSALPNPINNIVAGATVTSTITVAPINGFTGDVSLVSPTGTTLSSTLITGGAGTSQLSITVPATTAAGPYTVTVTGTSGLLTHSVTVTVNVIKPDFSISASPSSLSIPIGSSDTSTITITSLNGFSSPVTLSTSTITGVTTSFSSNPVTPPAGGSAQSLLTISVDATATAGTYSLTVTGTSGALSHSTTIPLTIPAPDFSLSASPDSLTIQQGSSGGSTITATSLNGFNSAVTLSLAGNPSGGTSTTSFTKGIAAAADDMEEVVSSGLMNAASSDLEMPYDGTTLQIVGLRFTGVTIPQGAVIQSAFIQFEADEVQTGTPVNLKILGEAADNAVPIATTAFNISNRADTTAIVNWSAVPAWAAIGDRGAAQKTPDIKTVIQEIVNRAGWASNNAILIQVINDNTASGNRRTAEIFASGLDNGAELTITYTSLGGDSGNPAGVTDSFSLNPVTPPAGGSASSTLTISVGASVATGIYTLTPTGVSSPLTHTTSITLTVPDISPPVISNVQVPTVTSNGATITWTTDELSNSLVRYGTSTPPTSTVSVANSVTSHSVTLTGLSSGTPYFFEVQSSDPSGNIAIDSKGGVYSFTTLSGSVVEFSDSFEDNTLNKWVQDSQKDWFVSKQRARDGVSTAEVDGSANGATITVNSPVNLQGKISAKLTYSWFIESNWDSGEYICLDIFSNNNWNNGVPGTSRCLDGNVDTENLWHDVTLDLSGYLTSDFKIQFRAKVSGSSEDGNVDKVIVTSIS